MKYSLSNEDIDEISEKIGGFLTDYSTEKRNILRVRLMCEEFLLNYQEKFGKRTSVTLGQERHLRRDTMVLRIPGERFDPFTVTEQQAVTHSLLTTVGMDPVWSYKNGCNCIVITPDRNRKISNLTWILLSVIFGFAFGFLAQLLPENLTAVIANDVLAPLSDTIMSFLSAVAILLIFLSVVTGVCGMGDMSTFQRIGKKMIGKFMLSLVVSSLVAFAVLLPFFPIATDGAATLDGKALYGLLLDIIPDNVILPFTTGNTIQIIFLAICFGITMLVLNLKVSGVLELFTQLTDLVQRIVEFIIKLLPIVVFISIFQLVALRQVSVISTAYRYPLLLALADGVLLIISVLRISLTKKVNPLLLVKKLLPSVAIAFATASSIAAFTSSVETCRDKLGVHKDLTDVGVPLGQVVFMPATVVDIFCVALCMGQTYGVPITVPWLVTLAIIAPILSIAIPPLPGAAISCHMLVMAQLGIPAEAIAIVIALNALIDRLSTPVNVAALQTELVQVAKSLDMLDTDTLRK